MQSRYNYLIAHYFLDTTFWTLQYPLLNLNVKIDSYQGLHFVSVSHHQIEISVVINTGTYATVIIQKFIHGYLKNHVYITILILNKIEKSAFCNSIMIYFVTQEQNLIWLPRYEICYWFSNKINDLDNLEIFGIRKLNGTTK